jgi:hypothetical protein
MEALMAAQLKAELLEALGTTTPGAELLGSGAKRESVSARGPPVLGDFLDEEETAAELRVRRRTLRLWRQTGVGPPFVRVSRTIYYRRGTLAAWLSAQETRPVRSRQSTVSA